MAENSKIEWTTHTFNPWEGCQKIGPGCDNCYAEARDVRFTGGTHWGPGAPRRLTGRANWNKPLPWDSDAAKAGTRPRVFCASLADVFDNAVDPKWRADLFDLIRITPNLDWLLLTKRPGNIAKMLPAGWGDGRPNVWLGCTVVNQEEADRDIPKLLSVPAAVRFLSMEPLLGPVDLTQIETKHDGGTLCINALSGDCWDTENGDIFGVFDHANETRISWVIVGGESGPHARPMHRDWARSLRDQCVAAGVPFLFKQWGEFAPGDAFGLEADGPVTNRKGDVKDWMDRYVTTAEGGQRLQGHSFTGHGTNLVYRVGKKAAGRTLDGVEWSQFPGWPLSPPAVDNSPAPDAGGKEGV